jgi:tetratricopeptide (TPR) repeat protein
LHADEEAVDLHRKLVAADPGITSELCQSLEHLALYLCAVGRHEEAVRAGEEFTKLRRKLAEMDASIRATTNLTFSLCYLGVYFRAVHRPGDALRTDEEAAQLRCKLPDTEMDPVFVLNNLRVALRLLGCHEEATNLLKT